VGDATRQTSPAEESANDRWARSQTISNRIQTTKTEFSSAKIVAGREKISGNLWRKKVQFGTTFVIATSSDSPRSLNYSQDSKPTRIGSDLCSYYLIVAPIAIRPGLQFGQEVHHGDLQGLYYQPPDMHDQQSTT
jgi:hypothetical protein